MDNVKPPGRADYMSLDNGSTLLAAVHLNPHGMGGSGRAPPALTPIACDRPGLPRTPSGVRVFTSMHNSAANCLPYKLSTNPEWMCDKYRHVRDACLL